MLTLFVFGLLPYVDNFAHIFGFLYGFLLAFVFLPYIHFGRRDRNRKRVQIIVSAVAFVGLTVVGLWLFYYYQDINLTFLSYLNCLPLFSADFCGNFGIHDRQGYV